MWMYLFNLLFYHISLVLFCWADVTVTFPWLIKFIILLLLLLSFQKSVTLKVVFQSLFVAHFLSVIESPSLPPLTLCPQDLQDEVAKETEVLQQLQTQRQKVQDALDELDQQKASLEEQLTHIRQQTNQETQLVSCLLLLFFFFGNLLRSCVITSNSGYFPFRSRLCSQSTRSRNKGYVSMRRSWSRPERSFWLCRRRAGNFRRRSRLPRSSSLLFRSLCVTLSHKLHRLKALPWFRTACLQRKIFSFSGTYAADGNVIFRL